MILGCKQTQGGEGASLAGNAASLAGGHLLDQQDRKSGAQLQGRCSPKEKRFLARNEKVIWLLWVGSAPPVLARERGGGTQNATAKWGLPDYARVRFDMDGPADTSQNLGTTWPHFPSENLVAKMLLS